MTNTFTSHAPAPPCIVRDCTEPAPESIEFRWPNRDETHMSSAVACPYHAFLLRHVVP